MGLESGTYISDLNPAWPLGPDDDLSQGDDHIRLIKSTLQATFPNITGAVTVTQDILNGVIKHNRTATTSPTVNDDSSQGYSAGSTWIDTTNDEHWTCLDATVGAAKWVRQGGQLIALTSFSASGSHTWNSATRYVIVEVWGGGGASGGPADTTGGGVSLGGPGAGGAYAQKLIRFSDLAAGEKPGGTPGSVIVTVGAGGVPTTGADGGNGGTSSYGSHVSATGGTGGPTLTASTGSIFIQGVLGGVATGGDININGGDSSSFTFLASLGAVSHSSTSGESPRGGGRRMVGTVSGLARDGFAPGGGGGPVFNGSGNTAALGSAGGSGLVLVWEFS